MNLFRLKRGHFFMNLYIRSDGLHFEIHHHWRSFDKLFTFAFGRVGDEAFIVFETA